MARRLAELLTAGQGFVFLHHALAGWPAWPGWAEVLGGRYHYAPGRASRSSPGPIRDSGTRSTPRGWWIGTIPCAAGVDDFELSDELYCCPVFEDDVIPLVRAHAPDGPFRETYRGGAGHAEYAGPPWQHPAPSDLIAWAKSAGGSPVVYIQPGDGPDTFGRPGLPSPGRQRPGVGIVRGRPLLGGGAPHAHHPACRES